MQYYVWYLYIFDILLYDEQWALYIYKYTITFAHFTYTDTLLKTRKQKTENEIIIKTKQQQNLWKYLHFISYTY